MWELSDKLKLGKSSPITKRDIRALPQGATLSDKSARQEFGLTQQEIFAAIRAGKLQFRESNMHGNPWFRLLRHEVEALVKQKSGPGPPSQEEARKGVGRHQQGSPEAENSLGCPRTATG